MPRESIPPATRAQQRQGPPFRGPGTRAKQLITGCGIKRAIGGHQQGTWSAKCAMYTRSAKHNSNSNRRFAWARVH